MLNRTLFPYQCDGADWLARTRRAYLADQMRLGKTPQAIEGVNLQLTDMRVCIVCPAYLRINWRREVAAWSWWPWNPDVLSYERATRDGLPRADAYIFDEGHYLKNPLAKRTQALLGLSEGQLDAFHPLRDAAFIWPLSGTPGNPAEVWTWLRVFGATDMPYFEWLTTYCEVRFNDYGPQIMRLKSAKLGELKALLGPWFKRRTVDQVGLPKARWGMLSLECGVDKGGQLTADVDPEGDALPEADEPLARLMREMGEAKVGPLVEALTRELLSGELDKIMVVAWHKPVLRELERRLAPFNPVRVDGDVSELGKTAARDRFNGDAGCRVFLGQTKCMVGIDLAISCSEGVFAELSWNPDDNAQAAARLLGPLQTRPVMWRVAASEHPLEYALSRVNARKSEIASKTWS